MGVMSGNVWGMSGDDAWVYLANLGMSSLEIGNMYDGRG